MQYNEHRKACKILKEIYDSPSNYLIIHYSCEGFYNKLDGKTPRITSIAVRSFSNGQTDSFSIHKTAEKRHVEIDNINEKYDLLEKNMLQEFFSFVSNHSDCIWIHWNMRDINYGFKAIEHRYEILGGKPIKINDNNKIDLSRILMQKYGFGYIGNPRMEKLMEKNKIQHKNWLNGEEEASAFANKEYVKLHQSTLSKVNLFENIIKKTLDNNLCVDSKWHDIYGFSPQGIFEFSRDNWVGKIIFTTIVIIIGFLLGKFL